MSILIEIILRSLEYGSIYALAALSIILVYRTSNITNFAQGVLGMFNTYVVAKLVINYGIPVYFAVFGGMLSAMIIGLLIDVLIIRHTSKVSPVAKQIITLGLISVILGLAPSIFGVYDLSLPKFIPRGSFSIYGASISYNAVLNISLGLSLMLVMFFVLQKTKWGLAIRTTASSESTAKLMGIPTKTITMVTWSVAGMLSVLAGTMTAPFSNVSLTFMNNVQVVALLACVLGGFQTFHGPVIGAYIIAVGTNLIQFYMTVPDGTIWGRPLVYLLILVFLVIRPFGLFGKKTVKKV
ncbi:MAG: branched-chain amino acid ABC transporter permease [Erysipelothrix sp.]|nr:branched-chain amino acid ABC transporter permease [Erysipelothrix sp.]